MQLICDFGEEEEEEERKRSGEGGRKFTCTKELD